MRSVAEGPPRVLVVGAGFGGLAAAAWLAAAGCRVQLFDAAPAPGGKASQQGAGAQACDAGPTVLTMRWVFDQLFEQLGEPLERRLRLQRCTLLARHAWPGETPAQLDLHTDFAASCDAVGRFAGAAACRQFQAFSAQAAAVYATLQHSFITASRPHPLSLAGRVLAEQGPRGLAALWGIAPFRSLWQELSQRFGDPRLRQLFARYATYCGSSPLGAPATLMLVAHVEREAVWRVDGGLHALARALAQLAERAGARLHGRTPVAELLLDRAGRRCTGLRLASGDTVSADAVVFAGDSDALAQGLLGLRVAERLGRRPLTAAQRSLSALTWHRHGPLPETAGLQPALHTVLFGAPEAYAGEFRQLAAGGLPAAATTYVHAPDRDGAGAAPAAGTPERLMLLVNAPARPLNPEEIAACEQQTLLHLARCGLPLSGPLGLASPPQQFAARFPGSQGALYGAASQGWQASFRRPAQACAVQGLYLAGGTTHPGPGVPMAALSGRQAALQLLADRASTPRWQPAAMPGGTSTR